MATTRHAHTFWNGNLTEGNGEVTFDSSGIGSHPVSWPARAEQPNGITSPEELIAAAHSACYSMALSHGLTQAGNPPVSLETHVEVDFQPGTGITEIRISVRGDVPELSTEAFAAAAEDAKLNCPVSQALQTVPITLTVQAQS